MQQTADWYSITSVRRVIQCKEHEEQAFTSIIWRYKGIKLNVAMPSDEIKTSLCH